MPRISPPAVLSLLRCLSVGAVLSVALACVATAREPLPRDGLERTGLLEGHLRRGWQMKGGTHMAALQLQLKPEWKTYWRAPGDAGIPPHFDWSGSKNVKSVQYHWPAPKMFHSNGMRSVGYIGNLILPIEVTPRDPSQPVYLEGKVDLGICKDICVPASLSLSAELAPKSAQEDGAIRTALRAAPAGAAQSGVKRIACQLQPIRDGLRITAQIEMPRQGVEEMVVFEPSLDGVWVSEAMVSRQGNVLTAVADMVPPSGQPFSLNRSEMMVTVIGDPGKAVEIKGCPAQ